MSADNIVVLAPSRIKLFFKCRRLIKEYEKNDNWMNYVGKSKPEKPFIQAMTFGHKKVAWIHKPTGGYAWEYPASVYQDQADYVLAWGCVLRFEP